jgi:PKHD-type hydroxylase
MSEKNQFDWDLYPSKPPRASVVASRFLDKEDIVKILSLNNKLEKKEGLIYSDKNIFSNNEDYRQSLISWIPVSDETEWLFRRLSDLVIDANERYFNFDLEKIENLQLANYRKGSFFKNHIDMIYGDKTVRKLSFVIFLTPPEQYEGGDLILYNNKDGEKIDNQQGNVVFFPSYTLHEVTPVTSGERITLGGWVLGSKFK